MAEIGPVTPTLPTRQTPAHKEPGEGESPPTPEKDDEHKPATQQPPPSPEEEPPPDDGLPHIDVRV